MRGDMKADSHFEPETHLRVLTARKNIRYRIKGGS